jgi:G-protein signaling modulator 2
MDEIYDLPPVEKARALLEQARAERREGRDAMAHGYCTQSLNLFRGHGDRQGTAAALLELADLALHHNPTNEDAFSRRKALSEEALAIYRELGDKRGTASALRVLASITSQAKALRMLEESLALAREDDDKRGIAASLERLGAHWGFRDQAKAVAFDEEALALYRAIGDRSGEALMLSNLAVWLKFNDDLVRWREHLEVALQIYRELGQKKRLAEVLMDLTGRDLDDETSVVHYTEIREISRDLGISAWEALSLRGLADMAVKRCDLAQAQALRAEADRICPETPIDPELLMALEQASEENNLDVARDAVKKLF